LSDLGQCAPHCIDEKITHSLRAKEAQGGKRPDERLPAEYLKDWPGLHDDNTVLTVPYRSIGKVVAFFSVEDIGYCRRLLLIPQHIGRTLQPGKNLPLPPGLAHHHSVQLVAFEVQSIRLG